MTALAKFQARNSELTDILDTLSSYEWALRFAAPHIMAADIAAEDRTKFQNALGMRSRTKTPAFNGLFVMAVTNFELFIKERIEEALNTRAIAAKKFANFDDKFRKNYIANVGRVFSGAASGTVGGIPFSRFEEVADIFSKGYVGSGALKLAGEVFTLTMGNPTWERLEKLLIIVGIEDPFDKKLATMAALKSHFANARWTEVLKNTESFHEQSIRRRNSIVHNIDQISLVEKDVREAGEFYEAFSSGIDELISNHA